MRYVALLCALLCGCAFETNNYYGANDGDGGVVDMSGYTDQFGDYHDEGPNQGVFRSDSKVQGNAVCLLQPAPAAPALGQPWPYVMNTPARAGAQTVIDLQTKDGMPHVVTVTMGFIGPPPSVIIGGGGNYPELVAILSIGIGGISIEAEVDVIDGYSFALSCSRLQINVVYRLIPGGALVVAAPAPTIQVGIAVSSGTIAHGRTPQRTIASLVDIAPNANEIFSVPAFSKSLRVSSLPNNVTPTVILWNNNGLMIQSFPIAGFPSADLPISNEARMFNYVNTSLINDTDRRLIFELGL